MNLPAHVRIYLLAAVLVAGVMLSGRPEGGNHPSDRLQAEVQCPMHPWVRSSPGARCTLCGMVMSSGALCGAAAADTAGMPVLLSKESVRMAGIRTSEVKKRPLVRTLRIAGMIGVDESRLGIISAPVDCRVDGLFMTHEGQTVTQRQPLATLFSPVLLAAAEDYKKALPAAGEPLDRAKQRLLQHGLVWEQIKEIPDRQPDDFYFGMLSPRSGTILKSFVTEGQVMKAGQKMFELADFGKMWFHAIVPEQQLPFIKPGQIVKLRVGSLPGVLLTSRIYNVSPNLEDMTRGGRVRVILENPERKLKNNAFAEGEVNVDESDVLAVPRSAVLRPGGLPRVYVQQGDGVFQPRDVLLGRIGDFDCEVLGGLDEGEQVAVSGVMLIDGQAQFNSSHPIKP